MPPGSLPPSVPPSLVASVRRVSMIGTVRELGEQGRLSVRHRLSRKGTRDPRTGGFSAPRKWDEGCGPGLPKGRTRPLSSVCPAGL